MAKMLYSICPKESAMSLWMSFLFEFPSKTFFMSSGLPTYLHACLPSGIEIYGNKNRMDRFYIFIKKPRGEKQEGGGFQSFCFYLTFLFLFCFVARDPSSSLSKAFTWTLAHSVFIIQKHFHFRIMRPNWNSCFSTLQRHFMKYCLKLIHVTH